MNLFNKKKNPETAKPGSEHSSKSKASQPAPSPLESDLLFKTMPSWWVVAWAYAIALGFCYGAHLFFPWFRPYLLEVFMNLRGLPTAWADLGLDWAQKLVTWAAVGAAVYHNLWQVGSRYKVTPHDIRVESWFPLRRVVSIPFGSVRRVGFQQGPLGLLCRYGHVEIDTGSPDGPLLLLNCPNPQKAAALLQTKVEAVVQPSLAHHR